MLMETAIVADHRWLVHGLSRLKNGAPPTYGAGIKTANAFACNGKK
jgi:hypothetical protein